MVGDPADKKEKETVVLIGLIFKPALYSNYILVFTLQDLLGYFNITGTETFDEVGTSKTTGPLAAKKGNYPGQVQGAGASC